MSIQYFPLNYFDNSLYGLRVSSENDDEEGPVNWILSVLENIASSLKVLLETDSVRIVAERSVSEAIDAEESIYAEIYLKSFHTTSTSSLQNLKLNVVMKSEIRILLYHSDQDVVSRLYDVISRVSREMTGNEFGESCIPYRSRITDFQLKSVSGLIFDLTIGLETQSVI